MWKFSKIKKCNSNHQAWTQILVKNKAVISKIRDDHWSVKLKSKPGKFFNVKTIVMIVHLMNSIFKNLPCFICIFLIHLYAVIRSFNLNILLLITHFWNDDDEDDVVATRIYFWVDDDEEIIITETVFTSYLVWKDAFFVRLLDLYGGV